MIFSRGRCCQVRYYKFASNRAWVFRHCVLHGWGTCIAWKGDRGKEDRKEGRKRYRDTFVMAVEEGTESRGVTRRYLTGGRCGIRRMSRGRNYVLDDTRQACTIYHELIIRKFNGPEIALQYVIGLIRDFAACVLPVTL